MDKSTKGNKAYLPGTGRMRGRGPGWGVLKRLEKGNKSYVRAAAS